LRYERRGNCQQRCGRDCGRPPACTTSNDHCNAFFVENEVTVLFERMMPEFSGWVTLAWRTNAELYAGMTVMRVHFI
jgi:hypothetical protein